MPQRASRARRLGLKRHVLLAGGALLIGLVGIAGVVRTSDAIDRLQLTSESRLARVSPISQLLPGAIANPGKYLAALNGSAIPTNLGGTASDPLFATGFLSDKQAMDRWEAVVAVGLQSLLFVDAAHAAHAAPTASASRLTRARTGTAARSPPTWRRLFSSPRCCSPRCRFSKYPEPLVGKRARPRLVAR